MDKIITFAHISDENKMDFKIKDKKRVFYTGVFGLVLIVTHILWRTVIETGMENNEYQTRIENDNDIGFLAKTKDIVWELATGNKPDREITDSRYISIFGYDLSKAFEPICKTTLNCVVPICNIFKGGFEGILTQTGNNERFILRNESYNTEFEIVWGCTSIKQILMFFFIMLTTLGKFSHRMLFFIISVPVIGIFNILRISAITCLSVDDMTTFQFWHDGVFRIIYYIFLFVIWLLWAEIITKKLYKE